jgi:hypothetical protein
MRRGQEDFKKLKNEKRGPRSWEINFHALDMVWRIWKELRNME